MGPQPLYRSYLYVPGVEAARIEKALSGQADAVVLDLEDAVAPGRKVEARRLVAHVVAEPTAKAVYVRVNSLASGRARDDIEAVAGAGLAGIRLPKADSRDAVRQAAGWLSQAAGRQDVSVVPLIESALGVERAWEIATAASSVTALALGEADLKADLGVTEDEGLAYARSRCVTAARAAGVVAVQSVFTDVHDLDGLRRSTLRGLAMGFTGRSAIHPSQVAVINEALTPTAEQRARAEEVVAAADAAAADGLAATLTPDGRFIDEAVVRAARSVLALAARPDGDGHP